MVTLNIHEAKTHLSRYLDRVEKGETIILCRHNKPIAELRPLPAKSASKRRVFEVYKGKFKLGRKFFAPLPEELIDAFEGKKN